VSIFINASELTLSVRQRPNGTTTFQPQNATNLAFEEELIAYWLSFVRAGNPNTFKLDRSAVWPSFATGKRMVLEQDSASLTGSSSFAEMEPNATVFRCQNALDLVAHQEA
jgi:carboxylesterase type B